METTLVKIFKPHIANTLSFKHASVKDIPVLERILLQYPSRSCDFTLGGILIWAEYFEYEYAIFKETLFIKGRDSDSIFFHKPLGALSIEESTQCLMDYCIANDFTLRIINFSDCDADKAEGIQESLRGYLPGWREYLYNIEQFTHFSGKKMEKKRNHLNFFMNHYGSYEMEILDGSQTNELIEFNDKFNLYHKQGDTFDYESTAIGEAIANYKKYPFFGLLIRYQGEIIGYTFGETSGDTFVIHAEKGNIEFRGVYQALASLLSREIETRFPNVKYLNREDDMDNEYLRKSKLSYHPTKFIVKWDISA